MAEPEEINLRGRLVPPQACDELNLRFETVIYRNDIHIHNDEIEITIRKSITNSDTLIQRAILAVSGTLDGQLLLSGQPIQVVVDHPSLRRGEGEVITTSCAYRIRPVSQEHLLTGVRVGHIAELIPPLAHALRDFRIGILLPPEDGAMFLWRSMESVLWFLADENKGKISINIDSAAVKLDIDPKHFHRVKELANHQHRFARHATSNYRERLKWLEKVYGQPAPPFFSQKIAPNDDKVVDVFPISFSEEEWEKMRKLSWKVLVKFISYLKPHVVGHLVVLPW